MTELAIIPTDNYRIKMGIAGNQRLYMLQRQYKSYDETRFIWKDVPYFTCGIGEFHEKIQEK